MIYQELRAGQYATINSSATKINALQRLVFTLHAVSNTTTAGSA